MVACTTPQGGGVRWGSRAVVVGLLWPRSSCMTRRPTPRASRWVAEACRSVWTEASWRMPRWRTTAVQVLWREVGDRGAGRGRAGNTQGRGRASCQDLPPHL